MSGDRHGRPQLFREVVVSSADGIVVSTTDGDVAFWNRAVEERTGYDGTDLGGMTLSDLCVVPEGDFLRAIDDRSTAEPAPALIRVDGSLRTADGGTLPVDFAVEHTEYEDDRFLVVRMFERSGDESETSRRPPSRERRSGTQALEKPALGAVRGLLTAESTTAACRACLDWATGYFGTDVGCLRLYDADANTLVTAVETADATALRQNRPAFDLDETYAGRALRRGEPVVEDGHDSLESGSPRQSVHVPLARSGVLSVFPRATDLEERQLAFATALGSVFAAGLVRSSPEKTDGYPFETIRARLDGDRSLRRLASRVSAAAEQVLEAENPAAVRRTLCESLGTVDGFETVRTVETDAADEWRVTDRSGSGRSTLPPDLACQDVRAAVRAVTDGRRTAVTVRLDGTVESSSGSVVTVVPVRSGARHRDAVVVARDASFGSDAAVRPQLETLGCLAGAAVRALRDEELLLSERRVELEFEVTGENCLAVPISAALGCHCEIEHATLTGEDDFLLFVRVQHADPDAVVEATTDVGSVTDCRLVRSDDRSCLVEVRKSESGAQSMMHVGATILEASAVDGVGRLVVQMSPSVDADVVADEYASRNPTATLVAKRSVDASVETPDIETDVLASRLTDKQRSALTTAYYAGYFNWPRDSTIEEVASSLDVTSPTFQQHLRRALDEIVAFHV